MARFCGEMNSTHLIANAKEFQQRCLLQGKSLLTDNVVWTSEYCAELIHCFIDNPDAGNGDFFGKLEGQLASVSSEVKVLAAEMLWFMFLCPSNTGPASKRQSIERVFSWSGFQIDPQRSAQYLSDDALTGVGSAGTAYNTGRWRELVYCIRITEALLKLNQQQRSELFNDHQRFAEWLESIPENENRQLRHMLLFLFFPDFNERIFGKTDRRSILLHLGHVSTKQYSSMLASEIDARLLALRKQFQVEYGTADLDYYVEPLKTKWKKAVPSTIDVVEEPKQGYTVTKEGQNFKSLNKILYGPPGTGKTFNTIDEALAIIDPGYLAEHSDNRSLLKARFDELVASHHISFVTFHQSFSYEDFVEGLKAGSEGSALSYSVAPGVFKTICERASSSYSDAISVDDFEAAILGLQQASEEADERIQMETVRGKKFEIEYSGGLTFRVFPHATESTDPKYVASIANVKKLYLTGSKQEIYNTSYVEGFLLYLKKHFGLKAYSDDVVKREPIANPEPYVLIIDEINRGNISNIFGELITLIEPTKRAGAKESLSVKLPYSKEPFTVPSNLYIVGTMNTADKSLAQVDIALRRRFEFKEIMPQPELLAGIDVEGIDITNMLHTINQRIELLYDREHTIGHSFFMPLRNDPKIERLARIFELEILPLLEEYFFEDWERVGQVLGDHLKTDATLRFVNEKYSDATVLKLMGNDWQANGFRPFQRNIAALMTPEAYIGIYDSVES
ncbi:MULTISPECIES: McrB family protein [unclassified Arsukibacterium]|uniref:McrB family protein n=1 Tax=unclassified Arsukibacterium TaxID=2635278 RepID=UPI000C48F42B|nr:MULTISPECIES: AAA family ATPase [unclassified Arsukibacterium]MAA92922.1 McrB [Rheinheimera sp.]MBM34987.1 McrB [Rheinheimera sp.]HAW93260.1 McrB [Candidatus Azambacteria bacterium]|tara:strand:- start:3329 stop:5536 length:2208 start_codon:yes stop_codon:yes gene_type:complete